MLERVRLCVRLCPTTRDWPTANGGLFSCISITSFSIASSIGSSLSGACSVDVDPMEMLLAVSLLASDVLFKELAEFDDPETEDVPDRNELIDTDTAAELFDGTTKVDEGDNVAEEASCCDGEEAG